jgi:hypothetical protein
MYFINTLWAFELSYYLIDSDPDKKEDNFKIRLSNSIYMFIYTSFLQSVLLIFSSISSFSFVVNYFAYPLFYGFYFTNIGLSIKNYSIYEKIHWLDTHIEYLYGYGLFISLIFTELNIMLATTIYIVLLPILLSNTVPPGRLKNAEKDLFNSKIFLLSHKIVNQIIIYYGSYLLEKRGDN